jgi:hypoxanthine phosphoribosyltransferase
LASNSIDTNLKNYAGLGQVLFSPEALRARTAQIGAEITKDFSHRDLIIVGVLKGALLFTCDLIRSVDLPLKLDFISITKFKQDGRSTGIRILKDIDFDVTDKDILLVQDIVDTGFSTNYLLKNLKSRGPKSLSICALLDRRSIRIIDVGVEYRGFTVGEDYVVGYGMDYREAYRDLPFVAKLGSPAANHNL